MELVGGKKVRATYEKYDRYGRILGILATQGPVEVLVLLKKRIVMGDNSAFYFLSRRNLRKRLA